MNKKVRAKLRNEQQSYDVQLDLQVRELWGQASVPDDYAIERVALAPGCQVEDDYYTLEYSFNGKQKQMEVRVANGLLSEARHPPKT